MGLYQLEALLYLLMFIGLFYANGLMFTNKLLNSQLWIEHFFLNTVIGAGFCMVLLFCIALIGILTPVIVLVTFSIVPLYQFSIHYNKINDFSGPSLSQGILKHAGLLSIILMLLLTDAYRVFLPEISSDAMRYHLPYARLYAENQGLIVNEYLRYPLFTHNINLVFSLGYLFENQYQGDVLARLFNILFLILLVFGLYSLTLKSFGKITAFIACLILIKVKMLRVDMVSAYVDIAMALFIFSCIYCLYLWKHNKNNKWLFVAAFLLGIALGIKYLALVWLIPITLWVYFSGKKFQITWQFFMLAVLIGSPWYIRNFLISGNPIHPFAQDFFGYWLWNAGDNASQKQELLQSFGVEKSLRNLIQLPWLLGTDKQFVKSHLGWALISGIPFLVLAYKMPKFFKHMAVFILFSIIFWFYSAQILRYFIAILPLLAIFAAYPLGLLFNPVIKFKWIQKKPVIPFLATCLLLYSSYSLFSEFQDNNRPLPQSDGDWQNTLLEHDTYYPFAKLLNDKQVNRVLNIGKTRINYTFNGIVLGDWFGLANFYTIAQSTKSPKDLIAHMNRLKVNYIIVEKTPDWANKINAIAKSSLRFETIQDSKSRTMYFLIP